MDTVVCLTLAKRITPRLDEDHYHPRNLRVVDNIRGASVTPEVIESCCAGIGAASPTKPTGDAEVLIDGTLIAAAPLNWSDRQRFSNALPTDAGPMLRRKSGNAVAARLSAHPDPVIVAGEVATRVNISTA
jgi:hypothetical protein